MLYYIMANWFSNDVAISVYNRIYQGISEIQYSFSKRPDEYRILNFIKGFLDGNEIVEAIFSQRLKILEKEKKSVTSRQSRWIQKGNINGSCNISDRSARQFPSITPPCSLEFCHELPFMREETDSLDEIINRSIQILRQDNPNEYVSMETQTCHELSANYIDIAVGLMTVTVICYGCT